MVELHRPVMTKEVLQYLNCREGGVYLDATLGDGGHAEEICRSLPPEGSLIGLDWDETALERAKERLAPYSEQVILIRSDYTHLTEVLSEQGFSGLNGVLIDLGASTLQLMEAKRGFSLHLEGDLDMRMDQRQEISAKDIVNQYSAKDLTRLFSRYGEERFSKRIAERIVREREQKGPITESGRLAEVVKEAIPARYRRHGGHPAKKVFQALRLAVNRELENIEAVLPQAVENLVPGGRICIIAYHSLEDRLVKHFLREQATSCSCPPDKPCICNGQAVLKILTGKAVKPSEEEMQKNPRSRSARLRAAERLKTA
ncbi:MAG: 16S rRNA (cytosine(1402)-N(4))-methyltransferase RsmH [Bacillota bacterium]